MCHKALHSMGQLLSGSGYYCQKRQGSHKLHFSILTALPEAPHLRSAGQVTPHAELNR